LTLPASIIYAMKKLLSVTKMADLRHMITSDGVNDIGAHCQMTEPVSVTNNLKS
jgi:hypothetical protein